MMGRPHGFVFELDEALCEGALVAVIVTAPNGRVVQVYAEVELLDRTVILRQFAIYGVDATTGDLGPIMLRQMARAALEDFDVDCIRIEEARRTSGARPGRAVRALEFRRRAPQTDPDAADIPPPG